MKKTEANNMFTRDALKKKSTEYITDCFLKFIY